jgi:antitoxin CptB
MDSAWTPQQKNRLRWQCRRALLELDIVLERFVQAGFSSLEDKALASFEALLALDDYALWALVNGTASCENPEWEALLSQIRGPAGALMAD